MAALVPVQEFCLERVVSEMIYYVLNRTLNIADSLTVQGAPENNAQHLMHHNCTTVSHRVMRFSP